MLWLVLLLLLRSLGGLLVLATLLILLALASLELQLSTLPGLQRARDQVRAPNSVL